eukprot:12670415-Alexandrium_andersonii.AAC.1
MSMCASAVRLALLSATTRGWGNTNLAACDRPRAIASSMLTSRNDFNAFAVWVLRSPSSKASVGDGSA